jgi:hypothetical protein
MDCLVNSFLEVMWSETVLDHLFRQHPGGTVHAVAQLIEALHYKPEGCGFDSPWCHWDIRAALWRWGRISL